MTALQPGTVFQGRYRVVRCIKAGGMGAVYEVVDVRTESPRALKVMLPSVVEDPDLRARFALEARVTGNITSDHIVRVLDAGVDDASTTPFLVMDLLQGEELWNLVKKRGPVPAEEVVLYLRQAALALDKTHAAGIVHRDLKPENLFVTYRDDGSPCVKILDFGIAKVVAQSTARATRAMGTPLYMSPEQIRGDGAISPRADVYALGHIAYALLTGEPYWNQELKAAESIYPLMATIMAGLPERPTVRAQRRSGVAIPPAFDTWFASCAALHPDQRYDRATTAVAALAGALGAAAPRAALPSVDPASSAARAAPAAVAASSPGIPAQGSGAVPARSGSTSVAVMSEAPRSTSSRTPVMAALALAVAAALGTISIITLRTRSVETPDARKLHAAPATADATVVVSAEKPPAVTPAASAAPAVTPAASAAPTTTPAPPPSATASASAAPTAKPTASPGPATPRKPPSAPAPGPTVPRGIF